MPNKPFALSFCLLFWVLASPVGAVGQETQFEPLDWINSDQAVVIQIDSMAALKRNLAALEFWDHEQAKAISDYAGSDKFQSLLQRSGLPFKLSQQDLQASLEPLLDALLDQSVFFSIKTSTNRKSLAWMLAVPTQVDSAEQISALINGLFSSSDSHAALDQKVEAAENQKIFTLPASAGYWFLDQGHLFVFGSLRDANDFSSRIENGNRPKRSFAASRKFMNSVNRGKNAGFNEIEGNVRIYFDPSIATKALPFLPEKFWNEFKLKNITGSSLQISFPESSPESDAKLKILVDGLVTFLEPLPKIHAALLGADEIDELPPFPVLLMDLKAASFDLDKLLEPLRASYESTYGKEELQDKLVELGLADSGPSSLNSDLPKAFQGTFVQARFLYSKHFRRGHMRALKTKDDEEAIKLARLFVKAFNKKAKREVFAEADEVGGTCWFFSKVEVEYQKDSYVDAVERSTGQKNFDRDKADFINLGYAVTQGWLFEIQKDILEDLVENRMDTSNDSLSAMLKRLRKNSDVRPIALWASWPYDWKIQIAGAIWNHEKKLRTRKNGSFSMTGFDMKLRELKSIKSIHELAGQLQIRASMILVDRVGKSMFTLTPQRNGFRISAGLFAPNEGE